MPPANYDVIFYPTLGQHASKKFQDVHDVMTEFKAALTRYLVQDEKLCEPDDARDIALDSVKAKVLMTNAKAYLDKAAKAKFTASLTVSGGIDKAGNLVISVTDAHPNLFNDSAIVRKEFVQTVIKLFRKQKNVVANIEPDAADELIKRNAGLQAARYGTAVQQGEAAVDVGGIKFGTIVLAAHGGSAEIDGTIIGNHLGQKTPEQIVALLTANADDKKRLSPKFQGTIILSGCFTAAGNTIVPTGYDYSIFAGKVKQLLDKKGYRNFLVKGMAGPSQTTPSGDKIVLPAAEAAARDKAQAKADLKSAEVDEAEKQLKALSDREAKLEKELDTWIEFYEQAAELVKADPQSANSKAMLAQAGTQFTTIQQKLTTVQQERNNAAIAKADKESRLLKRLEKLNRRLDDLATKYTTDGVLTFGQRKL